MFSCIVRNVWQTVKQMLETLYLVLYKVIYVTSFEILENDYSTASLLRLVLINVMKKKVKVKKKNIIVSTTISI